MIDWIVASSLATAGGTLVLGVATFAAVRSANNAAHTAERALLAGTRPLLVSSRLQDPPEKVLFADGKWVVSPGGGAAVEVTDDAIYLAISLRNVGTGIALLHGWHFAPSKSSGEDRADIADFRQLTRDIYVPASDTGYWQGAFRDASAAEFKAARAAIEARDPLTVDILYSDQEGGQRVVTRFALIPRDDGRTLAATSRHWNVDRPDPR